MPIDPQHAFASWFLALGAIGFSIVFALPLFFAPLRWARAFGWRLPEDQAGRSLCLYFGRCVGALALAVAWGAWRAAPHPREARVVFEIIASVGGLMVIVHVRGAIERAQPWIETAEIVLYGALGAIAWWIARGF